MRKYLIVIGVIMISTFLSACGQKITTNYPSGTLKSEGHLKNGKKHGEVISYYEKNHYHFLGRFTYSTRSS